jgi:S-adenosylmethionine-diacylgycerolhomoserine-N-methlytransferase
MHKNWDSAIEYAQQDLKPGGLIAVVDFNDSSFSWFKRWMGMNHVQMDGHLLPRLQSSFRSLKLEINHAYGGLWSYFLFIGQTGVQG